MNILGLSAGFHDAGMSYVSNGKIPFAGHSERYSKQKHDRHLNSEMLFDCLTRCGVPDVIAYYERPWVKKTRQLYAGQWNDLCSDWSVRKMVNDIDPEGVLKNVPIKTYNHHLSHAAAGFQTSPYEDATVVVIDAIGEWDTISIWDAKYDRNGNASYTKLWGQKYPHSIGLMYSAFTKEVGLRPLDEEYILMGMAAYGNSQYKDAFKTVLLDEPSSLTFRHNLHLGLPDEGKGGYGEQFDVAAGAQELVEELIGIVMQRARTIGTSKNLVYMGGVALNCSANRDLGAYYDNIWIMPNPGDAGSSLGAAALAYGKQLEWKDAYLGYDIKGPYPVKELMSELLETKIVGVASGPAEFGPRALGNRSLLADPRGKEIKDQVNAIKRRQKFRPFAPIILEEYVGQYFSMPNSFATSDYMQTTAICIHPKEFPAIIHKDGTSRVQTVPKNSRSGIRQLLEAWNVWTGCPMLLNTSLNIRGEPMVNDLTDARRFQELYGIKVMS
jgi:carbamoyltransferase